MNSVIEKISKIGIVPVIKIDDLNTAAPLAKALCEGGLPVAEVTFRTDLAKEAMILMKKECPEMLLGAGTVLTTKQVDDAIEAGAEFIVSPGLNPKTVEYCIEKNIPIVPGTANASDIEVALSYGITTVKFFPAEALGGLKMIKALAAPYVNVNFMPTGGVNESNICDYLAYDRIVACGGTWMIKADLIKEGKFDEIEKITRSAVSTMLGLKLDHVGINATTDSFDSLSGDLSALLNAEIKPTSASNFIGSTIEVMKHGRGERGHICYTCNSVERAMRYFESRGYTFAKDTIQYNAKGKPIFAYFENEYEGFGIHLKESVKK